MKSNQTNWALLTPVHQGAIAIIQLHGDVDTALKNLTGKTNWSIGDMHLVSIASIDELIAVKLSDSLAQLMPHGGLQIIRALSERFDSLGIEPSGDPQFPEAANDIEAAMLHAIPRAASPIAVELLLQQPAKLVGKTPTEVDLQRASILNQLLLPPKVVLLGDANTGKSTLMNALTSQETSIVHNQPGVTRDAVGARVLCAGLVIDVFDLPGFRETDDAIEQGAIDIAQSIIEDANLVLLIADSEHSFLTSPISNHLKIGTKADIELKDDAQLCISAQTGDNMQALCKAILDALIPPEELQSDAPWFFEGSLETLKTLKTN